MQNHKGKLIEEEKSRLCYNINCTKLSNHLFMHLVQNPRLPLRFVVQAMLVEQLHSHHSMLHRATTAISISTNKQPPQNNNNDSNNMTLGAMLQRDAVSRQSAQIRSSMQATSFRIEKLERELATLRRHLQCSQEDAANANVNANANANGAVIRADTAKAASFRIVRNRIWEGEDLKGGHNRDGRGFGAKLVNGFKSLFRRTGNGVGNGLGAGAAHEHGLVVEALQEEYEEEEAAAAKVAAVHQRWPGHRRNRSTS